MAQDTAGSILRDEESALSLHEGKMTVDYSQQVTQLLEKIQEKAAICRIDASDPIFEDLFLLEKKCRQASDSISGKRLCVYYITYIYESTVLSLLKEKYKSKFDMREEEERKEDDKIMKRLLKRKKIKEHEIEMSKKENDADSMDVDKSSNDGSDGASSNAVVVGGDNSEKNEKNEKKKNDTEEKEDEAKGTEKKQEKEKCDNDQKQNKKKKKNDEQITNTHQLASCENKNDKKWIHTDIDEKEFMEMKEKEQSKRRIIKKIQIMNEDDNDEQIQKAIHFINDQVYIICKKRSQNKKAISAVVNVLMSFLDDVNNNLKIEIIENIKKVTEGKIFVEVERARVIRMLAEMKEGEGNINEAADILQEVQVETFSAMDRIEKTEYILKQMELVIKKGDYVRCQIISKKINIKTFDTLKDLYQHKLRYYDLIIYYYLHQKMYKETAESYQALYLTLKKSLLSSTSSSTSSSSSRNEEKDGDDDHNKKKNKDKTESDTHSNTKKHSKSSTQKKKNTHNNDNDDNDNDNDDNDNDNDDDDDEFYLMLPPSNLAVTDPNPKKRKILSLFNLKSYILYLSLSQYENNTLKAFQDILLNESKMLKEIPLLKLFLEDSCKTELLQWPLSYGEEIKENEVFKDVPHPGGEERWTLLRKRVLQHNIRVIGAYYSQVRMSRISELLSIDLDEVELEISELVCSDILEAKIDRLEGTVVFGKKTSSLDRLNNWSSDISKLLDKVSHCSFLIQKERMIHAARAKSAAVAAKNAN